MFQSDYVCSVSEVSNYQPITSWAEDDRPREKLMLKGRHALSDAELVAILLGSGSRNESAVELARRVLVLADNNLNELGNLQLKDLMKLKGIGEAKAITIAAALELGRRRKNQEPKEKRKIVASRDAFEELFPMLADLPHEEFWVILLNRANRVLESKNISKGGVSGTFVDPKSVFSYALEKNASSVILGHNHPSGNMQPSQADIDLTRKMKQAGLIIDISVQDHVIICGNNYYSFVDEGKM